MVWDVFIQAVDSIFWECLSVKMRLIEQLHEQRYFRLVRQMSEMGCKCPSN